jgi:glycosyltransferase involved in cell wall biosynthesis
MKVLLVTTSYPDFPGSQRGIFIRKLCLELLKNGLDVLVLTPRILSQSAYFEDDSGIKVYRFWFPSNNKQLNQMDSIPMIPMIIYMASGLFKALHLIVKYKPDVIHGNWIVPTGLIAAIAGRILRVPVLNTAHGLDMRISEQQPIRALFELAVKLSHKTVIVSPSMKTRGLLQHAEVIPMGVDEVFFRLHPGRNTKTVVYTRSLESVYDVETLIRSIPSVIKSVPNVRFIIAGTGTQKEHLQSLAQKIGAGEHSTFLGHLPSDQIPALMEQASVYVATALADGTSPALLEAIAAGLTPVVTDIEANRSLVNDGQDGFLFKSSDPEDLAKNIIHALSGGIPNAALDRKRQEFRSRISWNSVAREFISIYNELTPKTWGVYTE